MSAAVTVLAAASMLVVSVYLVLQRAYEDGLIGRVCLAGVAVAATGYLTVIAGGAHAVGGVEAVLLWSSAGFLVRHAYRYYRFTTTGAHSWSRASNDGQRVVQWETFAPDCQHLGPGGSCRHQSAERARPCAEATCPLLVCRGRKDTEPRTGSRRDQPRSAAK